LTGSLAKRPEGPAGDSASKGGSRNINRFRAATSEIAALGLMLRLAIAFFLGLEKTKQFFSI